MSFDTNPIQPVTNDLVKTQQAETKQMSQNAAVVQEEMQQSMQSYLDQFSVNTMQIIRRNGETLEERVKKKARSESPQKNENETEQDVPLEIEATEEVSGYYENKNPEIKGKSLQSLKEQISKFDTPEDILQKIMETFPDPVMADAAFDYLLQVIPDELKEKIYTARSNFEKRFSRALKAGKNVLDESLKFSKDGLGEASELRQFYTEFSGNPKAPLDLFEELLVKFTFEKMKQAIGFWLSALGADLNSKGSSIEKGELHKLIDETRTLQAILGVYKYFASKQKELILSLARKDTAATPEMNYQNLAKIFVKILQDIYPSPDKILSIKHELHIEQYLHAQESVLNIMCSGINGVAPRLFRNEKHKKELMSCFLIALEAIDNYLGET
jgi:type III secretion protein W